MVKNLHSSNLNGPTFISLFCGCGGLDLGFLSAGFRCIGAFDNDPQMVDLHQANLNSPVAIHDLTGDLFCSDLKGVDIVLSGSPCQGFSTAGKRNFDDPRNKLLVRSGELVLQLNPTVFIAENVRGVMSGKHKEYWESLRCLLKGAGYKTADLYLDASLLGIPQIRKRIVMIAWRNGKEVRLDLPLKPPRFLKDAFVGIDGTQNHVKKWVPEGSDDQKIAKRIKPSQKLSNVRSGDRAVHTWHIQEVFGSVDIPEIEVLESLLRMRRQGRIRNTGDADPVAFRRIEAVFGSKTKGLLDSLIKKKYVIKKDGKFDLTHTFNGKYRRFSWDKPSLTVDTRFGDWRYFLHPSEDRGFTVREAARIQGFPDEYIFHGSETDQFRAIGNAVPPPMGQAVANVVERLM